MTGEAGGADPRIGICSIGAEVVSGDQVDTNAAWLAGYGSWGSVDANDSAGGLDTDAQRPPARHRHDREEDDRGRHTTSYRQLILLRTGPTLQRRSRCG